MAAQKLLKEYQFDEDFIYEGLVLDITDQIISIMKQKGLTQTQLAKRMGVSPSYISRILSGTNFSIRTLSKIFKALNYDATIKIKEWKGEKEDDSIR